MRLDVTVTREALESVRSRLPGFQTCWSNLMACQGRNETILYAKTLLWHLYKYEVDYCTIGKVGLCLRFTLNLTDR